jgi:DNA polymerase-1
MLLQVHDELVLEVPTKDVKKVGKLVKDKMENVYQLDVPIHVDVESGINWGETKKMVS